MIYLGDGETDVPAMKMIKLQGGKAIAVYDPGKKREEGQPPGKEICEQLIEHERADFIAAADYREGSELDGIIRKILIGIK